MSWLRSLTVTTFQRLNPDWDVRIWTGKVDTDPRWTSGEAYEHYYYEGKDWRDTLDVEWATTEHSGLTANLCADVTRWQVLGEGEIFSDFDILYQEPIDAYLPVLSKASVTCNPHFALGICGGGAEFKPVYERSLEMATPDTYQSAGVFVLYAMRDDGTLPDLEPIPMMWVHPHSAELTHKRPVPADTLGYHWYGGLAESQRLSSVLTPDNLDDSYLAAAIRRVIS